MIRTDSDDTIQKASAVIKNGGVVVYPTETVYGIGCNPWDIDACNRIKAIKGREGGKPFLLIAADMAQITNITQHISKAATTLAAKFWPGPLTIVLPVTIPELAHIQGPSGGIGFRVSSHPVPESIARVSGFPIVSTSANRTGESPAMTYSEAFNSFGLMVDMIIENHIAQTDTPSTVIDCTSDSPVILREGAIPTDLIMKVLHA